MFIKTVINVIVVAVLVQGCCDALDYSVQEVSVDEGENLTIACTEKEEAVDLGSVIWVRKGRNDEQIRRTSVRQDGALILTQLSREDVGVYTCSLNGDITKNRVKVIVRTPPPALVNVTVHPSTILALLRWDVTDNGGYPITHFTVQYRLRDSVAGQLPDPWHSVNHGVISVATSQLDVFQLEPNSSYLFQVWANNRLGKGDIVELEATTHHDNQEIELGRHLLEGAETFDTRVWLVAVAIVMGTLVVLTIGTLLALYKECHIPLIDTDDQETMELVPNIILNPGYHGNGSRTARMEPDENSNDTTTTRLNNNTVVQPFRV